MSGVFNPDDWKDVFVLVTIAFLTLVGTCVTAYFGYRATVNSKTAAVNSKTAAQASTNAEVQVTNNHTTNLRDDVTRAITLLESLTGQMNTANTRIDGLVSKVGELDGKVESLQRRN